MDTPTYEDSSNCAFYPHGKLQGIIYHLKQKRRRMTDCFNTESTVNIVNVSGSCLLRICNLILSFLG